jgi:hypothetical protein
LKISQFGARILEARRLGFQIENKTENVGGKKHSWYRIVLTPGNAVRTKDPTRQETIGTAQLFAPDSLPVRWADPEEGGH